MTTEFNEGAYADKKFADEWVVLINALKNETRDRELYPWLSKWITKNNPKKILEIGSGTGICSQKIDLNGAEYIGVEPSAHLRKVAKKTCPKHTFLAGRAESLPIESNSMDVVFSMFVWLHITDLDSSAKELARVLKSKALFAIVTANPEAYDLWRSWHDDVIVSGKELKGRFKNLHNHVMVLNSMDEIKTSLTNAGLCVEQVSFHGLQRENPESKDQFAMIISGHKA